MGRGGEENKGGKGEKQGREGGLVLQEKAEQVEWRGLRKVNHVIRWTGLQSRESQAKDVSLAFTFVSSPLTTRAWTGVRC